MAPPCRLGGRSFAASRLFYCLAVCCAAGPAARCDEAPLESTRAIRALTVEQARQARPVRLRGVVVDSDRDDRSLVLEDATGGMAVRYLRYEMPPVPGQIVEVEGVTEPGSACPMVVQARVTYLRRAEPPPAAPVPLARLAAPATWYRLVEVTGVVRQAYFKSSGKTFLRLDAGGLHIRVTVRDQPPRRRDPTDLVDGRFRLRGICLPKKEVGEGLLTGEILVASFDDVVEERPPPERPFDIAPCPVADWPAAAEHRIKVEGVVTAVPTGVEVTLAVDGQTVRASLARSLRLGVGDRLQVIGFPRRVDGEPRLELALGRLLAVPFEGGAAVPVLATAGDVRHLPADEAMAGRPVRLRGVVTFAVARDRLFYIHDMSSGLRVYAGPAVVPEVGRVVDVDGWTEGAETVRTVRADRVTPLGWGVYPAPRPVAPGQPSGGDDGTWAVAEGVVRRAKQAGADLHLELTVRGAALDAVVVGGAEGEGVDRLVDAAVSLRGVCSGRWRPSALQVPDGEEVVVMRPAPADPFALPPRTAAEVLSEADPRRADHRVRVRATVTLQRGPRELWVEDDSGGLVATLEEAENFHIGDIVDLIGFPLRWGSGRVLVNAAGRVVATGPPRQAEATSARQALAADRHACLLSLEGEILANLARPGERVLVVAAPDVDSPTGRRAFEASLPDDAGGAALEGIAVGSRVRVAGVCVVQLDGTKAVSYSLFLRAPGDVALVQRPPLWTPRRAAEMVSALALVAAAALAWVLFLRRRVRLQTEALRARNEHESRLEEQLRQAQKMEALGRLASGVAHDVNNILTVINGYAGLLLMGGGPGRDTAAEITKATERGAALTRQLLAFSRKHAVVPSILDLNGVVGDIEKMVRRLVGPNVEVVTSLAADLGRVRGDPRLLEQALFNLAANARDAMPQGGTLTLTTVNLDAGWVRLRVADTGCGMTAETQAHLFEPFFTTKEVGKGTGLGLALVYAAVEQCGGRIAVDSTVGVGTTFLLDLPRVAASEVATGLAARQDTPADGIAARAADPLNANAGAHTIPVRPAARRADAPDW